MNLTEIFEAVQAITPSATIAQVEEILSKEKLSADLVDSAMISVIARKAQAGITPTSQSLATTQPIATNSSIKGGKLAPKKEGAIAEIKKRGSSKVAKNQPIEKVQIEKASIKSNIQAGEVSVIEEAASAGYNSDVGTLAASAYLGGVQMRFADEVSANMPKAMGGMFDGIGKISDERHQGVFDHVRMNQPHQEEAKADEWSF